MWPAIAAAGISAAAGAFGNKSKQTQTAVTSRQYQPLEQLILNSIQGRLSKGGTDLSGYSANGISDINHVYDLVGQRTSNDLTARGLGTSPVAGAVEASGQQARAGGIAQFMNSIPLLQRQLQTEDLGLAGNVLNTGRGIVSTSTSGGGAAGAASGLGSMLGFLIASGAFNKGAGGGSSSIPAFGAYGG